MSCPPNSPSSDQRNNVQWTVVWGGADKSLAWPPRCRRTESIVSLETGVCSCAELQVFSYYRGWEEACQATRTISTTWRRELSSSVFFFLQGQAPKEIPAILTETLGEHSPSYATVKNWVAQFFKLGHPVFDGGIRWCMFPYCFCQNGANFLRRLALQGKKKLDDGSRLHVVEIVRVARHSSFQPL